MSAPLYIVDSFTDRAFGGNPAGVCLLEKWPADAWLQLLGREMNLSETACIVPRRESEFGLRWFTPRIEVDLCGHATLAAAHVLWESGTAPLAALVFHTRSGPLTAIPRDSGEIELDFPATPARPAQPPAELFKALGLFRGPGAESLVDFGRSDYDYLFELNSETAVREMDPDFLMLERIDCRGIIVTARSDDPRFDFVSRFFAPTAGINEDPVTGSAHCCLAEWWGEKLARTEMTAYQASERGGIVKMIRRGGRVGLVGQAVTVSRGELLVRPD